MNKEFLMKAAVIGWLVSVLCACGVKSCCTTVSDIETLGQAKVFHVAQQELLTPSVENSLLNVSGDIIAMHDPTMKGSLFYSNLGPTGKHFSGQELVLTGTRFAYVMQHEGNFYNFGLVDGSIYVWRSTDLKTWVPANQGNPVLTRSLDPHSIFYAMYNVGVTVDDSNVWHMLVETSDGFGTPDDQGNTGLAYVTAFVTDPINSVISFDSQKTETMAIPHAGNADLKFIPGKGLLAVYGKLNSPVYGLGKEWYVTMSTYDLNSPKWVPKDFVIGAKGKHVADPSLVETSYGTTLLSISYDQKATTLLESGLSLSELF